MDSPGMACYRHLKQETQSLWPSVCFAMCGRTNACLCIYRLGNYTSDRVFQCGGAYARASALQVPSNYRHWLEWVCMELHLMMTYDPPNVSCVFAFVFLWGSKSKRRDYSHQQREVGNRPRSHLFSIKKAERVLHHCNYDLP